MGKQFKDAKVQEQVTVIVGYLHKPAPVVSVRVDNQLFVLLDKSDWLCKAVTDRSRGHAPLKHSTFLDLLLKMAHESVLADLERKTTQDDPMLALVEDDGSALADTSNQLTPVKGKRKKRKQDAFVDKGHGCVTDGVAQVRTQDVMWEMNMTSSLVHTLCAESPQLTVYFSGRGTKHPRIYVLSCHLYVVVQWMRIEVTRGDIPEIHASALADDESWSERFDVVKRCWQVRLSTGVIRESARVPDVHEDGRRLSAKEYSEAKEHALKALKDMY